MVVQSWQIHVGKEQSWTMISWKTKGVHGISNGNCLDENLNHDLDMKYSLLPYEWMVSLRVKVGDSGLGNAASN